MKKGVLFISASFFSGFALMVMELVSSRIMSPIIGSSVITWTSVIGTTILGLSIGALIGGHFADKYPVKRTLFYAFLASALLVGLIPALVPLVRTLASVEMSLLVLTSLISFSLFLLPATAMGSIQPIILKLYAKNFTDIGKEYGAISAAWSLGSILGVFLTGFLFVATIGSIQTLVLIALVLIMFAAFFHESKVILVILFIIAGGTLGSVVSVQPNMATGTPSSYYQEETPYYLAQVVPLKAPFPEGVVLFLDFDSHSFETKHHPNYIYTEIYPIFSLLKKEISTIHVIGAGAYTLPKHFFDFYNAQVTVSEIDPAMERIGERFFSLNPDNIRTIVSDSRVHLARTNKRYDIIFGDAFNSFISVPWHLMTREFNELARDRLNEGGIYALNFIGSLEGESAVMFRSVRETFRQTFPNHYVFFFGLEPDDINNIVLIGLKSDNKISADELREALGGVLYGDILADRLKDIPLSREKTLTLTDNFAPVERLLAPIIKKYFPLYISFLEKTRGV